MWARELLSALGPSRSMRRFMGLWISGLLCLFALTDGWIAHERAVKNLLDTRDRALARIASGYLRSLRNQDADTSKIPPAVFREELGVAETPRLRFSVTDEHGELLGGDPQLQSKKAIAATEGIVQAAFYDDVHHDEAWRVAVVRDYLLSRTQAQPVIVQIAEPQSARVQAKRDLLLQLLSRQAAQLALVLSLVWLFIRLGLRPLDELRRELKQRRPQDRTLLESNRSEELAPVVGALNEQLRSQQESIDQQRKFLADASHQLRTPLAVLRTQVQGMLFKQTEAPDALPKMLRTIDRATGLTNQLLSMAKVEQLVKRGDWCEVNLKQVAQDVALEFAPLIARKRLDFSLQANPVMLMTDAWLLGELVKNLVSNAIHHSKKGAALGIVIRHLKNEVELIVWDHGGGVEEGVLARLFEPFNAAKGGTGIGLGLSICRQIAESMNATVDLFNRIEGGEIIGVDAVVRWPVALANGSDTPTAFGSGPSRASTTEPAEHALELPHG
jgi:signal transduction histidine kinase